MPVTSWPAASSAATARFPATPVAPATNTRMLVPPVGVDLFRILHIRNRFDNPGATHLASGLGERGLDRRPTDRGRVAAEATVRGVSHTVDRNTDPHGSDR